MQSPGTADNWFTACPPTVSQRLYGYQVRVCRPVARHAMYSDVTKELTSVACFIAAGPSKVGSATRSSLQPQQVAVLSVRS